MGKKLTTTQRQILNLIAKKQHDAEDIILAMGKPRYLARDLASPIKSLIDRGCAEIAPKAPVMSRTGNPSLTQNKIKITSEGRAVRKAGCFND